MAAIDSDSKVNGVSMLPDLTLQHRYTELLEKRIAQLEALIGAGSIKTAEVNGDKDENSKDDKDSTEKKEETNDKKDKKAVTRYRSIVRSWDKKTGAQEDTELSEVKKLSDDAEIAFTFRRVMDPETGVKDAYSEVDIEANGLRDLLKMEIGDDYPGQNFDGDIVEMRAPFPALVHNWTKLENAVTPKSDGPEDTGTKQAREDLARLLDTVKAAPELQSYFKTRESNLNASITTYETMWSLFAPKTKIIAKLFLNTTQIFAVEDAPIPYSKGRESKLYVLAWCWDWNGKEMIKVYYNLPIDKFRGTKDINQLPCYPLEYYKNGTPEEIAEFCNTLKKRGVKYKEIVRSRPGATQMYSYNGEAVSISRSIIKSMDRNEENDRRSNDDDDRNSSLPKNEQHRKIVSIQGKFIVDPEAFLQYGGNSHVLGDTEPFWVGEIDDQSKDGADRDPDGEEFVLFPPRFLGYSTKEKLWGQFSVDGTLNAPGKQPAMFEKQLQLNDRYKSMIQALVNEHEGRAQGNSSERTEVRDIVSDKGKGLVLLFHGPPGVGKTLTAETIAEATGKPLFVVSVAEIGLNASRAEKNLEQMFYLAGKWEAVLLVDEADVFLEARSVNSEPNRNALVSVLLRVLEYYHGIMILTTNRIKAIDVAVQSRIHLAIRYDDLDKKQKENIFKIFLRQLEPDSIKNEKAIFEFVEEYGSEHKLNGRQIRNVVSSALSLARNEGKNNDGDERLDIKYLKTVLNITKDFQEQLESVTNEARSANEATRGRR